MLPGRLQEDSPTTRADVVCFGMVTPATLVVVKELPAWNTGATWDHVTEFISDDGAIVAILLKEWGIQTGLICTTLGDDTAGRRTARELKELGILGDFRLSRDAKTPYELNISDGKGGRTYFWRRDPDVLATLDSADLSLIDGARMLYADWYDGDHVLRGLREAGRLNVPVFFNFEHGHADPELLARYAPYVTVCQAVTDPAQTSGDMLNVASCLLRAGIPTAIVTLADQGCLGATAQGLVRVHAPRVNAIDGCAAGATFSAGHLYGLLNGWNLERSLRFAVAAASLGCTKVGPTAFPLAQIAALAESLEVERE